MTDYESMEQREMDALVAERLMGLPPCNDRGNLRYSTDERSARLMRDRIAELGLQHVFVWELIMAMDAKQSGMDIFSHMQATPRQQAIAALRALDKVNPPPEDEMRK